MRLLSQNFLKCNVANCTTNNYPLEVIVAESEIIQKEFNKEVLLKLIEKLDWDALYQTIYSLNNQNFPKQLTPELKNSDQFLQDLNRFLMETHIIKGGLKCNGCEKIFPIENGIPNMILKDDEI